MALIIDVDVFSDVPKKEEENIYLFQLRHDRFLAVIILRKGICHGNDLSFGIHVDAGLVATGKVHIHQHPHVIGMIPGGRLVVLGQPPLAADEGVEVIVRHVSVVGLAFRAGEVLVVHQLRVGRDGTLQERIQIMLMTGDENIYADLVQPLRPGGLDCFVVVARVYKGDGDVADGHGVGGVLIFLCSNDFVQHAGLLLPIQVKLCRFIILPPVVVVILAQIEHYTVYVRKPEGVIEHAVPAAGIFVQILSILALDLVVASGIDYRDHASGDLEGNLIGYLGILIPIDHAGLIPQKHDEVKGVFLPRMVCKAHRAFHSAMYVREGQITDPVCGIHRGELVLFGKGFASIAAERPPVDHLPGADLVALCIVQRALRHGNLMHQVFGPHTARVKIVVFLRADLYPDDGGVARGKHDLVVILHRVDRRPVCEVAWPKTVANDDTGSDQCQQEQDLRRKFPSPVRRVEKQQAENKDQRGGYTHRSEEFRQDELDIIVGAVGDHDADGDGENRGEHQRRDIRPSLFVSYKNEGQDRKQQDHAHEYADHERQVHHKKAGVVIRSQEFGNARPVDAKRDPEQENRRAAEHGRHLQPVFLNESVKGHFHTSLLIRPNHKMRRSDRFTR